MDSQEVLEVLQDDGTYLPSEGSAADSDQIADTTQDTQDAQDLTGVIQEQTGQILGAIPDYDFDGLLGEVRSIGDTLRTIEEDNTDSSSSDVTTYTVLLDDSQWQELRESWLFAKDAIQAAELILACVAAIVAFQLGVMLGNLLVKGWRHG